MVNLTISPKETRVKCSESGELGYTTMRQKETQFETDWGRLGVARSSWVNGGLILQWLGKKRSIERRENHTIHLER